ncbi:kinase-like domain-containing protein [Cokeromyces recurvatus]|uniref:kinase-like domain-containing protein n=1 Tax=Cokeromyces recurvatus TaxID=90255 RepID=UPI00221EFAC0|nr:kinase-like domain-containing protein [Cokeromyces recurvatus]KAI7902035.1 kinase-like domain-containing protein [Cokeromyces recurvatus]
MNSTTITASSHSTLVITNEPNTSDWTSAIVEHERLVVGPDGNQILCDSPTPSSELPPYTESSNSKEKKHFTSVKPRRVIGNYTLINTLGSGSMGKVRLAVHNLTGDKLAVKIVRRRQRKDAKDENREIRTIREASIMLLLHHPYIVSLKEMVILDPYYYLFMEYVNGGQLLDYIISHGKLKEKQARRFGRQILSALDYCHRNSIVHRDLKIENILISQTGNIKIIDFGLSNLFSPQSSLNTFCGSLYFAAPELLNAKAYTGPEVDVWSFGVVLYVLVCGKVPFDDQNMPALHAKIKRGVVEYPSYLSTECKSILSRMLVINPAHRATISELMIHPWITKGNDHPINNYLPERIPLTLPIDMEVVRGMTGFEFGTEDEIKRKLEEIIISDEYQKAAKQLMERTAEAHRSHRHGHLASRFNKKSFTLANDDPQSIPAAYHPLVSIYYLVKERIEREKQDAKHEEKIQKDKLDQQHSYESTIASSKGSLRIPDISLPETVHPTNNNNNTTFEQSLFGDSTMFTTQNNAEGVAYGKKGKTHIRVDGEGHVDRFHIFENGFSRFLSNSRRRSVQSSDDDECRVNDSSKHVLRRLSHALSRTSSNEPTSHRKSNSSEPPAPSTSTPVPIPSSQRNNNKPMQLSKSYAAAETSARYPNHNDHLKQSTELEVAKSTTLGNRISRMMPRRMTVGQNFDNNIENHTKFLNMVQHNETTFPISGIQQKGTADENIKPVFLKGLFSVTTTSTKHPSVIRADLIRVLERIGVKWRESKGRFECVHMPSIDLNRVVENSQHEYDLVHVDSGVHQFSSSEEQISIPPPPPPPPPSVSLPDLVVRFEIYIVKVPWLLGMHGLQFRRVGGDPWQYKNMCSKILAELKL